MDEFKIIKKYIKTKLDSSIILGTGDDCCVLEHDSENYRVVTSDLLVEHKHFRLQDINFKELGYKSLAVNLSDISAMGARAKWCQLSLALPSSVCEEDVSQFFKGFYELADKENISLVGGDLSSSDRDVFVSVTLSGLVKKENIKKREDFSKSGVLCVTGKLGESGAGLKCLLNKYDEPDLIQKHIRPKIYHQEGLWLGQFSQVKAMMDLSDGLLSDLKRLACGVEIDLDKLPLSRELIMCCEKYNWNPEELGLCGGEDYVLLFSCEEDSLEELKKEYKAQFKSEVYVIGKTSSEHKNSLFIRNNESVKISYKTFSHF